MSPTKKTGTKAHGEGAQAKGAGPHRFLPQDEMVSLLRAQAQPYLRWPGVTSVGVGFEVDADGQRTGRLEIQFTVDRKLKPDELESAGRSPLPKQLSAGDGTPVPVRVIERSYRSSFTVVPQRPEPEHTPENALHKLRRAMSDPLRPGISIGSARRLDAGTAGAIVFDNQTGQPYILSNWHVLHTAFGAPGDNICQPGRLDDAFFERNVMGQLVRSHLGLAGDCAICSIERRGFDTAIIGLDVRPRRIAKVALDDRVVKSSRTTGVTRGIVRRVGVVVKVNYGGAPGEQQIGGFEIGPDPAHPSTLGEISSNGDSGAVWMIDSSTDSDVAVGLHFAGETDPRPSEEHALACNIHSVLEKLNVSFDLDSP